MFIGLFRHDSNHALLHFFMKKYIFHAVRAPGTFSTHRFLSGLRTTAPFPGHLWASPFALYFSRLFLLLKILHPFGGAPFIPRCARQRPSQDTFGNAFVGVTKLMYPRKFSSWSSLSECLYLGRKKGAVNNYPCLVRVSIQQRRFKINKIVGGDRSGATKPSRIRNEALKDF